MTAISFYTALMSTIDDCVWILDDKTLPADIKFLIFKESTGLHEAHKILTHRKKVDKITGKETKLLASIENFCKEINLKERI